MPYASAAMSWVAEATAIPSSARVARAPVSPGGRVLKPKSSTAIVTWLPWIQPFRRPKASTRGAQRNFSVQGRPTSLASAVMRPGETPLRARLWESVSVRRPYGAPDATKSRASQP